MRVFINQSTGISTRRIDWRTNGTSETEFMKKFRGRAVTIWISTVGTTNLPISLEWRRQRIYGCTTKQATEKILIVWSTVSLLAHPCRGVQLIPTGARNSAALNPSEQINFCILIDIII